MGELIIIKNLASIISNPPVYEGEQSEARLNELKIKSEVLLAAVAAGYLSKSSCTKNDTKGYPGYSQWNHTIRGLRNELLSKGWERSEANNTSCILSPCGTFRILASSGNLYTGNPAQIPTNKNPKGPRAVEMIDYNVIQGNFFHEVEDSKIIKTYILLYFNDKKEIRAELSVPAMIDKHGYIRAWSERIMLPSQPIDGNFTKITKNQELDDDIDIKVEKKA